MSLLDDARELLKQDGSDGTSGTCAVCGMPADMSFFGRPRTDMHRPGCPWLSMPKIVAALEAAEVLIEDVRWKEVPVSAEVIWFAEDEYGKARVDGEHVHRLGLALKGEGS